MMLPFFIETSPWLVVMRRSGPPLPTVPLMVFFCKPPSGTLICGEVAFDVSVGGVELVGEVGLLGDGDADGAVAIFDGDVAEGRRAGDVDGAVAIGDGDVAGDAVEGDVAAVRGEGEGPDGFAGGEVGVGADVDLAVEAGELEVGAAGVELDGAANAFEVGVAEELAAHGERAAEIGEGGVVGVAFEGE